MGYGDPVPRVHTAPVVSVILAAVGTQVRSGETVKEDDWKHTSVMLFMLLYALSMPALLATACAPECQLLKALEIATLLLTVEYVPGRRNTWLGLELQLSCTVTVSTVLMNKQYILVFEQTLS